MIAAQHFSYHDEQAHNEKAPFVCTLCDYRSFTENGLKGHMGRYHGSKSARIACENNCGSFFTQRCGMTNHMKRYCKLTPRAEKDRYKQMDEASGRNEMKRKRDKVKIAERKRLLEFGPEPPSGNGYPSETKFHY